MKKLNMLEKNDHNIKIRENLKNIKNVYIVMSGKGGVGKSTVSSMIASGLVLCGKRVGILDCDFHGPSIPFLFGCSNNKPDISENNKMIPIIINDNLKLMSISFLLDNDDQPIIWRGPMKNGALMQFLDDVEWGNLDYLIIDLPPGTGDEVLNIIQTIKDINGAIVVTIPQDVSLLSVRKSLSFLNKTNINIIGLVSNMDGFICPKCNEKINIFNSKNMNKTINDFNIKTLVKIPIDIKLSLFEEEGKIFEIMKNNKYYLNEIKKIFQL